MKTELWLSRIAATALYDRPADYSRPKRFFRIASLGLLALCTATELSAQEAKLQFEVASVKRSPDMNVQYKATGPGTRSPERFTVTGTTLRGLMTMAYGLIDPLLQVSGPAWIDSERYAINSKMAPGTTRQQFEQMLQNLLAERFKLVFHRQKKVVPVYELQQGKGGHKLRKSPNPDFPPDIGEYPKDVPAGFPRGAASKNGLTTNLSKAPSGEWTKYLTFRQQHDLTALLINLKVATDRNVIDKTGLSGTYDFDLFWEYTPAPSAIFDTVQQQLGLRLVDAKAPLDVIVIDSVEKIPTED